MCISISVLLEFILYAICVINNIIDSRELITFANELLFDFIVVLRTFADVAL